MTEVVATQLKFAAMVKQHGGFVLYTLAATILGTFAVIWMVKPEPLVQVNRMSPWTDRRQRRYRMKGPSFSHGMAGSRRRQIEARRAGGLTPHEEVQLLDS